MSVHRPSGAAARPTVGEPSPGTGTVEGPRSPAVSIEAVAAVILAAVVLRPILAPHLASRAFENGTTLFVAITVQALPFLTLGVLISGLIAAFVTPSVMARLLPRRALVAVPVAGLAGMALPGCECGSVPIAGRLIDRGSAPAAALAFLLSAPAINPVVLVATSVAFPGRPQVVVARFVASLATALVTALVWARLGGPSWMRPPQRRADHHDQAGSRWQILTGTALHDMLHAGGFLVVGATTAAVLQTLVPETLLGRVAGAPVLAVATMAVLAVTLAVCSQADAFVAAGFTQFSMTARLVFLVVGPAVDVKLIVLQSATFGRSFAVRFAPLTLIISICCALLVGWWLL